MHKPYIPNTDQSVFEIALENAVDAVAILEAIKDKDGQVVDFRYKFVNKAGEKFVDREDLAGRRMLEVFPQHIENGLFKLYKRVYETGRSETSDFFYGEPKNVWANLKISSTGEGIIVYCIDISGQRDKEELLLKISEELKETISNQHEEINEVTQDLLNNILLMEEGQRIAKLGNWEWDLRNEQVKWSKELCRILGCEYHENSRQLQDFFQYIHPEDIEYVQKMTAEAERTKIPIPIEYRIITPAGEVKHAFGTGGYEMKNEQGEVIKLFGIIQDITARKKVELELAEALKQEKELGELKSRFVSMASHEFRTPLATILTSTSLLDKYHAPHHTEKRIKHINRIRSNVQNMRDILDDFLSLSRLEEGRILAKPSSLDIDAFFEDVIELFQDQTKENQTIRYEHIGEDKEILLDEKLLRNSCINLISNAIKYSRPDKSIFVKSYTSDNEFKIEVIDQGIGIPEEDKERMFTRFFRAKNSTNIQGTGLGLTIVKRYVDLMGGEISFESVLEEGSTFRMVFPQ